MLATSLEIGEVGLVALAIWREASNQSYDAMLGVGWSIRNRVTNPSWWGRTFLEVIGKKWQYSSMTAAGDPNLLRYPIETDAAWQRALGVAAIIVTAPQNAPDPTGGATSYHDKSIAPPSWTKPMTKTAEIGAFMFYKGDEPSPA